MKNLNIISIISVASLLLSLSSCETQEIDTTNELENLQASNSNEKATNENHLDLRVIFYRGEHQSGRSTTVRINGNFERNELKKRMTKNIQTAQRNLAKSWKVENNSHRNSDISYEIYAYGSTDGKGRRTRIGHNAHNVGEFDGTRLGEKNAESISFELAISN